MKQLEPHRYSESTTFGRYTFLTKISEILDKGARSKNLICAIYLLEQKKFFYCNRAFEKILGAKMDQFYEKEWDFWFANMCPEESLVVKNRINDFFAVPFDQKPLTLKYHIYDGQGNTICLKHEMVLHKKGALTFVINYFFDVSEKERIERCLNGLNGHNKLKQTVPKKPISPREEEVLKLIADGYSSKQIADRLFISNHTAISHRKHLIEKFQVKNTAQLIKKASKIMEL
ncbi:MAG: response regulator transcription factor [Aurantibacter sp.]